METLQDVLDKTNVLYPYNKLETRQIREKIIAELCNIGDNLSLWDKIDVIDEGTDFNAMLDKWLKN